MMITMAATDAGGGWHDDWSHGAGWWLWWPIGMALWLVIAGLVVWLLLRRAHRHEPSPLDRARTILAERYARGEIDSDEFQQRMDHLR